MKKFLPILFMSVMLLAGSSYTMAADVQPAPPCANQQMRQSFEQRLKLTDTQKEQARKIHEKGFKQMKPIMLKKDKLRKDIAVTKKSNMDEKTKNAKIKKDMEELRKLHQKAEDIRRANGKEFEKILTKDQLVELEKMKAEGRRNFAKNHPPRPPFNMVPDFKGFGFKGFRPMMPPPPED